MRTIRYPKPAKRAPKPPRPIPRGKRPRVRMPSAAGDYRARLKYGLDLWRKLVYAKEPSGVCPCCLKREWHDAAHCFAKGPYRSLCLEPSNGAPLCRVCHRRIDSDHHAKEQFFTAYMGPAEYERLRLLAMSRSKMDLGLTLLLLEDMTKAGVSMEDWGAKRARLGEFLRVRGGTIPAQAEADIRAALERASEVSEWRYFAFAICPHDMKYGDDGEMQCNGGDFRRGAVKDLTAHVVSALQAHNAGLRRRVEELERDMGVRVKEILIAEAEVKRLEGLILNGTIGDWEAEAKRIRAQREAK